jgi:hypothetical protein
MHREIRLIRAAIHQLDAALADWRTGMADAAALAVAAASVLDAYAWDRTDTYLSMSSTGPLGWAGDMDGFICEMPEDENLPAAPMTAA